MSSDKSVANNPTIPPNLTHLTPLTKNELLLLSTYEQIKHYEKISAKLKATEAKRRLEEADERYRAKVRERERLENGGVDDDDDNDTNVKERATKYHHDDNNHSDSEEEEESSSSAKQQQQQRIQQQRQLEITQLRSEIQAKSQKEAERDAARKREEEMRRELLGPDDNDDDEQRKKNKAKKRSREEEGGDTTGVTDDIGQQHDDMMMQYQQQDDFNDEILDESFMATQQQKQKSTNNTIISGPSIKKKRLDDTSYDNTNPSTSLIANISGGATPIHDFSTKLKMSKTSLDGSILFPTTIGEKPWRPPNNPVNFMDGCF